MSATRLCLLLSTLVFCLGDASSQAIQRQPSGPSTVLLNVVVSPRSGEPVSGLTQADFSVLDNSSPATISSFKQVTAAQEPVSVILVIDAVNIDFERVAYAKGQVEKFLRASEGHLAQRTTLAVLTDRGLELEKAFTNDGNLLSNTLESHTTGLREITRGSGFWGADERVQISLTGARQLTAFAASVPGRKIVLWVSPGWPLLSGVRVDLTTKQQQQIFANVVAFSQQLQKANVTFYNVNPLGPTESLFRSDYYTNFVKGVSKPSQTDLADLSLQVLAVQSGGLALNSNDVAGNLAQCLRDVQSWYELTVTVPPGETSAEYNHLQVKLDKPGLTARTRDGYYAQP